MALSIKKELFPQQFSTNIRLLVIDHDINLLNVIQNVCYKFHYLVNTCSKVSDALNLLLERKDSFDLVLIEAKMHDMDSYGFLRYVTQQINIPVIMMCADNTRSAVIKAIDDGACDYWTKPLCETLIQNMWQHVARKLWNKNKNLELSEDEVGMKRQEIYDSKLPLIDPKIEGVVNTGVKQESVENNNDEPESSPKKTRVKWSSELHRKFINVVMELNVDKAVPKKILARMNEPGLTREHVASHLQKYKQFLKIGETKKQKKHNRIAEATETKISNGSSEFDFQAYNASIPRVVPNNLTPTSFPQQPNNLIPPVNAVPVNVVPVNAYQIDSEEETSSSASINQQSCSGFGTNSIINTSFLNALNARYPNMQVRNVFLAWHNPSTNSNDSTSSNDL